MKKRQTLSDPDFKLFMMLRQARDAMQRVREKELRQFGISGRQTAILYIVQAIGDRATPAEIARWQLREAHSISGILSRMEKDGLVRKSKDLERRNLVRISLTPKGKRLFALTQKREAFHRLMSHLTDAQRKEITTQLQVLRDKALKEMGVEAAPFP